jgi:8-amino-7-oxononanoate synthase
MAAVLLTSLDLIAAGDDRRAHLQQLIIRLRAGLAGLPWRLLPSRTAIQPLLVGDNEAAVGLSECLFEHGLWVPAIRPPTVPVGTARLRVSLSAAHAAPQLDALIKILRDRADHPH